MALINRLLICFGVAFVAVSTNGGEIAAALLPPVSYPTNSSNDKVLILAAFNCDSNKVEQVLDAGADVNARYGCRGIDFMHHESGGYAMGARMFTPLMALAEGHHAGDKVSIAKLLLKNGAKINAHDGFNRTALYLAVGQPTSQDLACYLIANGCDVNMKVTLSVDSPFDTTPLHVACISGSAKVISALIDAGADVNALDSRPGAIGWTPLDYAMHNNNEVAITLLRKAQLMKVKSTQSIPSGK